jgi:hypothetical protein
MTTAGDVAFQLTLYQIVIESILDAVFIEIAAERVRVSERYKFGARAFPELMDKTWLSGGVLDVDEDAPAVRVRVDRWIVELITELVESRERKRIRGFVREAILSYIDRIAEEGRLETAEWG